MRRALTVLVLSFCGAAVGLIWFACGDVGQTGDFSNGSTSVTETQDVSLIIGSWTEDFTYAGEDYTQYLFLWADGTMAWTSTAHTPEEPCDVLPGHSSCFYVSNNLFYEYLNSCDEDIPVIGSDAFTVDENTLEFEDVRFTRSPVTCPRPFPDCDCPRETFQ